MERAPLRRGRGGGGHGAGQNRDLAGVQMEAPADVAVETPGVRIPRSNEVSWRIRPLRPFSGQLR
jgi:hypothetical protein